MNAVTSTPADDATLIRRVNQLYHELTCDRFDDDHRYRHRIERRFWQRVARIALGDSTKSDGGRVVLDLACGTGFVTEQLAPWLTDKDSLIACDLATRSLQHTVDKWRQSTRSRTGGRNTAALEPLATDAQRLPIADDSVDLVALNAALHHVPDPIAVLLQIDRVLKPGGCFALGFEPNRTHFASSAMAGLTAGLNRASWYASPKHNLRRIRERISPAHTPGRDATTHDDDVLASRISSTLQQDGLIEAPLDSSTLLDLVDHHARGADTYAGFVPDELIELGLPGYEIMSIEYSDYLGQTGRMSPVTRALADGLGRALLPDHGSLFSWIVRKPRLKIAEVMP